MTLKIKKIIIYRIIKSNRKNLLKLLIKMKQEFVKNILYDILIAIIQDDVLLIA